MYALPGKVTPAPPIPHFVDHEAARAAATGPLARLVRTPIQSDGHPPFALADQSGHIQRYVEPVPGIDLQPFVGQVVVVRHDTGRTLLASQLELPPQPLYPMLEDAAGPLRPPAELSSRVEGATHGQGDVVNRAQFVDDDDTTVQLLPDEKDSHQENESAPVDGRAEPGASSGPASSDEELPAYPSLDTFGDDGLDDIVIGPLHGDPHSGGQRAFEEYPPDFYGTPACPECGGYHDSLPCPSYVGYGREGGRRPASKPCKLFGEVELNFFRTHLPQTAVGKLSEKYELSPRLIVGFRDTGIVDGRVRYWTYGRDTRVLGDGAIRADFDVFDIEATHSQVGTRSEVTIGAGIRLASIDLTDADGLTGGSDLIGMTLSADGRVPLRMVRGCLVSAVYGGRISILGGDWGGAPGNDFTDGLAQDDNVVVHELLGGLDVATSYRHIDLHARLGFEMQNWHSDALAQNAGADSIGFIGPGLQLGAEF